MSGHSSVWPNPCQKPLPIAQEEVWGARQTLILKQPGLKEYFFQYLLVRYKREKKLAQELQELLLKLKSKTLYYFHIARNMYFKIASTLLWTHF